MAAIEADEEFMVNLHTTPRIASSFTGWHYQEMREIVPFVKDNDPEPPDFLNELFATGKVRGECLPPQNTPLNAAELKVLEAHKLAYY